MNWRNALLAVGIVAALVGLAMAFVPSVGNLLDAPRSVPYALGAGALIVAMFRVRTWLGHEDAGYETDERERPTGVPSPGHSFDGLLERASGRAAGGNTRSIKLRQMLREAAVDALTTYHGHTEESAQAAINNGEWTDDQYAVEFFTTSGGVGGSLSESITSTFSGEAPFDRRAAHAAREIERLTGGEQ